MTEPEIEEAELDRDIEDLEQEIRIIKKRTKRELLEYQKIALEEPKDKEDF